MSIKSLGWLSLIALAGCANPTPTDTPTPTTSSSPSSGYQIREGIHYSEHWVPTPAVDLMSADGTFIRAFFEARKISWYSRPGELTSYPGYLRADKADPPLTVGDEKPAYGYTTRWVLSFEEGADNTVTAFVCSDEATSLTDEEAPPYLYGYPLRYHRTGTPPPANQKGPARAPAVAVFGDWYATSYVYDVGSHGKFSPSKAKDERCAKDPGRPVLDRSPVSTPGWPAQSGV